MARERLFEDRQQAIRVFNDHIEEVKRVVAKEKLLIYNIHEGWKPLCGFLHIPIPEKPFPHINDRKTTQRMYLLARIMAVLLALGTIGMLVGLAA